MTVKTIGEVYRITWISTESSWFEHQPQLVGYRGELIAEGSDQFFTLKMIEGPHAMQTVAISGARLRLAPRKLTCRCSAYRFPHRAGSGECGSSDPTLNEYVTGTDQPTKENDNG